MITKDSAIQLALTGLIMILTVLATSCTAEPLQEPTCSKFEYVTVEWKVFNLKTTTNKTLKGTKQELEAQGWAFHPEFGHSGLWRKIGASNSGVSMWHVSQEIKDYKCKEE